MKINKKIVGMMIAISVLVFGTGIASHAMNERTEKIQKIEAYVQEVRKLNSELATTGLEDIPATITLNSNLSYEQLYQYITNNNLEIVQLEARGIDSNGEKTTFASKTYKGLLESNKILMDMAQYYDITFCGYNAMYVLVDAEQIISIQNDASTFLLDTSAANGVVAASEDAEVCFPHSLAWTLEEVYQ